MSCHEVNTSTDHLVCTQFHPSKKEEVLIRELLKAEEELIVEDDFIIEEDDPGK